jgi:hypothetical protein
VLQPPLHRLAPPPSTADSCRSCCCCCCLPGGRHAWARALPVGCPPPQRVLHHGRRHHGSCHVSLPLCVACAVHMRLGLQLPLLVLDPTVHAVCRCSGVHADAAALCSVMCHWQRRSIAHADNAASALHRNCTVCRASDGWLTIALHSTSKQSGGAPLGAITEAPKVRLRQLHHGTWNTAPATVGGSSSRP